MKNILGLDLGTTSISFAHIVEDENKEKSEIKELGVRIVSLTTDEQSDFEKGKSITTNANRTLKHGARLNLDRYQQRRKYLIDLLQKANLITSSSILAENGKNTTHSTWQLRAKAVTERVEKEEFARVLLAINKKRGYKSSRKAKTEDEGQEGSYLCGAGRAAQCASSAERQIQVYRAYLPNYETGLGDGHRNRL